MRGVACARRDLIALRALLVFVDFDMRVSLMTLASGR